MSGPNLASPWPWVAFLLLLLGLLGFAIAVPPVPSGRHVAYWSRRRWRMSKVEPVTMYERVGVERLRVIVEQFYRRVLADPRVAHYFDGLVPEEGLARLKRHQALVLGQALGGPVAVDLSMLRAWHAHLSIDGEAYAIVGAHLRAVLYGMDTPTDIVRRFDQVIEDVRPLIVSE